MIVSSLNLMGLAYDVANLLDPHALQFLSRSSPLKAIIDLEMFHVFKIPFISIRHLEKNLSPSPSKGFLYIDSYSKF